MKVRNWIGVATALVFVTGCGQTGLEMDAKTLREDVTAAIVGGLKDSTEKTAQLQGSAQGQEPGYASEVEVFVGTCVRVRAMVYLKGVSGQVQAATQGSGVKAETPNP
jgi:hypothetical protein